MKKIIFRDDLVEELEKSIICLKFNINGEINYSYVTTNIEFILSFGNIDRATEDFKKNILSEEDIFDSDESFLFKLFSNNQLSEKIEFNVYDIFSNKLIVLNSGIFDGEIIKIASLYSPENENNIIKDSKLYIGNKTGAVSVSNDFTNYLKDNVTLSQIGIKDDETFFIFSTVNEYDQETKELKSIYLLKGESEWVLKLASNYLKINYL